MVAETSAPVQTFTVDVPNFQGTLGELAHALRSSALKPQDINVYTLVRTYLTYFNTLAGDDLELASEALPMVARVVELKVRLLLPRPPKETEEAEEELLEETLEAITLLEDLEDAIAFLKNRRETRRIVLPAKTPRPDLPRAERPLKVGVEKLSQLASRYRFDSYFELAIDRLTMASAMKHLMSRLRRLRGGRFTDLLEHKTWAVAAVTFAGMLELFKEGKLRAHQEEAYGPIDVELKVEEKREAA